MSLMSRGADRLPRLQPPVAPLFASMRSRAAIVVALHAAAFLILCLTEAEPYHFALFALAWGLLNFAWLVVFGRPGVAAALSLLFICAVIGLSWFKMSITWATLSFFDFVIVDPDTFRFVTDAFPQLRLALPLAPLLIVLTLGCVRRS